jgi:hypothetical protein
MRTHRGRSHDRHRGRVACLARARSRRQPGRAESRRDCIRSSPMCGSRGARDRADSRIHASSCRATSSRDAAAAPRWSGTSSCTANRERVPSSVAGELRRRGFTRVTQVRGGYWPGSLRSIRRRPPTEVQASDRGVSKPENGGDRCHDKAPPMSTESFHLHCAGSARRGTPPGRKTLVRPSSPRTCGRLCRARERGERRSAPQTPHASAGGDRVPSSPMNPAGLLQLMPLVGDSRTVAVLRLLQRRDGMAARAVGPDGRRALTGRSNGQIYSRDHEERDLYKRSGARQGSWPRLRSCGKTDREHGPAILVRVGATERSSSMR